MDETTGLSKAQVLRTDWFKSLSQYEKTDTRKAIGQVLDTFLPYGALWGLLIFLVKQNVPFLYLLPLILLASGFVLRAFIIFHDCAHNAFLPSRQINRVLGYITGVITFTPFDAWKHSHAMHHATSGDLDRRGHGDVWTLTVEEFHAAPKHVQIAYQVFRHPLFLFFVASPFKFLVINRFTKRGKRGAQSVLITNFALLALLILAYFTIGLRTYFLIQIPIITLAAMGGVWLFYLQHQFEGTYWARHDEWDPVRAALEGSSYYDLPPVLQWFTGNIGMHHIHHLRPGIPNYHLQWCYKEIPTFQKVEPITLDLGFKPFSLNLWDEKKEEMISFRAARQFK
jgi:acyl-lipid omega-6 desaturase (Delta-12 desaturase)